MGRKNFKPIYIDHEIWQATDDSTTRYYALTDRQVMALQAFTEYLLWRTRWDNAETWDAQQVREWRAALELALQVENECGEAMDCNDILACLDDSIDIIQIKQAIINNQIHIQSGAVAEALAAYGAAGDDIFVYNPNVPANYNGANTSDDNKLLCIAVLSWVTEVTRQISNATIAAGVAAGVAIIFGGWIAALTSLIPAWLALIANVPALELIGYTLLELQDLHESANDDYHIGNFACRFSIRLGSNTFSYATYLTALAATPSDTPLSIAIKALLANEAAYLYFADTIGKVYERDTEALEYDCNCGETEWNFSGGAQGWIAVQNALHFTGGWRNPDTNQRIRISYTLPSEVNITAFDVTHRAQYSCGGHYLRLQCFDADNNFIGQGLSTPNYFGVTGSGTRSNVPVTAANVKRIELAFEGGCPGNLLVVLIRIKTTG